MSVCLFSYIIHITRSFTANGGQSDCTKRKISKLSSVLFSFFQIIPFGFYVSVCIFSFNKITFRKVRFICCFYTIMFYLKCYTASDIRYDGLEGGREIAPEAKILSMKEFCCLKKFSIKTL